MKKIIFRTLLILVVVLASVKLLGNQEQSVEIEPNVNKIQAQEAKPINSAPVLHETFDTTVDAMFDQLGK